MLYVIDARLEQTRPTLRVLNRQTNAPVLAFDSATVLDLIEAGAIYPPDFLCPHNEHALIQQLFLVACSQQLHIENYSDVCVHCAQCQPEAAFSIHRLAGT